MVGSVARCTWQAIIVKCIDLHVLKAAVYIDKCKCTWKTLKLSVNQGVD